MLSIFDTKANLFHAPFWALTNEEGMRKFGDDARRAETVIARHPSDYHLYRVGTYNQATGEVAAEKATCLAIATDFIVNQNNVAQLDASRAN